MSDYYCSHIEWTPDSQRYVADRDGWEREIKRQYESMLHHHLNPEPGDNVFDPFADGAPSVDEVMAARRRVVRAHACGYLAGHIADSIMAGMAADEALRLYDCRNTEQVEMSDIAVAQGLCDLLPPGEYDNAVHLTEQALRRPDVWDAVQRVASKLEQLGLLEEGPCEDDALALLPSPEKGRPPAPDRVDPRQA